MSVLAVIDRPSGAAALARFAFRVARALEEELVVLCLEEGAKDGKTPPETAEEPPEEAEAPPETAEEPPETAEEPPETAEEPPETEVPPSETAEKPPETAGKPVAAGPLAAAVREALKHGPEETPPETPPANDRPLPDPEVEVRSLAASSPARAVLDAAVDAKARVLVAASPQTRSGPVPLARRLFVDAPCHTILVRAGETEYRPPARVLVPAGDGPHARLALQLGEKLARAEGGKLVALYVEPDFGEFPQEVGERILGQILAAAELDASSAVEPRVAVSDDRRAAIAQTAEEGFDLVLLGESSAGSLRRRLFGTIPDGLLAGEGGTMVAVTRREWRLMHRLRQRLGRWLDLTIPQMRRAERVALYEKLQSGSVWNFDFAALISLSTGIAALGLLQSSTAVVIGAMLVAPLMTPILGAGLALVQGNLMLMRNASRATVLGYLMALAIGFAAGTLFPIRELTPELLARGGPTLLDMGVAFLSGLAAAFCLARPGLVAALPGVAIAAALVPPIATTGVCVALGELATARGSAILFGTNVIAIILGAAVSFYAGGVRGRHGARGDQLWVRYALAGLVLSAAVLTIPLGSVLLSQLSAEDDTAVSPRVAERISARVEERLVTAPGIELVAIRRAGERAIVELELRAPAPPDPGLARALAEVVRAEMGPTQRVRIRTQIAIEVR